MKKFMPLMLTVGLLAAVAAPMASAETATTTTTTTQPAATPVPSTQPVLPATGGPKGGTVSTMSDGVGPCGGC